MANIFLRLVIPSVGEGRGVKMLHTYIHTYIHTDRHTDRHKDPLTKWVVEELSLLKKSTLPFCFYYWRTSGENTC